jgi:hypothetical protein
LTGLKTEMEFKAWWRVTWTRNSTPLLTALSETVIVGSEWERPSRGSRLRWCQT